MQFEFPLVDSKNFVSLVVVEEWLRLYRKVRHWHLWDKSNKSEMENIFSFLGT